MFEKRFERFRREMSIWDIGLIKWAVLFFTLWIVGFLCYWIRPLRIIAFIVEWRWAFFSLFVITVIMPTWKFLFGKKSEEGITKKKIKTRKKKR